MAEAWEWRRKCRNRALAVAAGQIARTFSSPNDGGELERGIAVTLDEWLPED